MHTYIHTYIHTHIHAFLHTYIHTYIHTHTHTHAQLFIFSICIKSVHNWEVAPICPHISFLWLNDAHRSNYLSKLVGKFNFVILTPTSKDGLTKHYHYFYEKLVMTKNRRD